MLKINRQTKYDKVQPIGPISWPVLAKFCTLTGTPQIYFSTCMLILSTLASQRHIIYGVKHEKKCPKQLQKNTLKSGNLFATSLSYFGMPWHTFSFLDIICRCPHYHGMVFSFEMSHWEAQSKGK